MTPEQVCQAMEDALTRHDAETIASLYTETAVLESPLAGRVTGRAAILDALRGLLRALPDALWTFEPPLIDGRRIAVVGQASGTHSAPIMGLAASGRSFRFSIVFLVDLEGDHIVRDRRFYDFTGLLIQLGVLKARPA